MPSFCLSGAGQRVGQRGTAECQPDRQQRNDRQGDHICHDAARVNVQARPVFLNTHPSIAAVVVTCSVDHLAMVILNDTDRVNPSGGKFHE